MYLPYRFVNDLSCQLCKVVCYSLNLLHFAKVTITGLYCLFQDSFSAFCKPSDCQLDYCHLPSLLSLCGVAEVGSSLELPSPASSVVGVVRSQKRPSSF